MSHQKLLQLFEDHLQAKPLPAELPNLYQPCMDLLEAGGKRVRPVLLLLAVEAFGGNPENALDTALGIELFHNFSLAHDDIMDGAETRRGKATIYKKYGLNAAILGGDALYAQAISLLQNAPPNELNRINRAFARVGVQLCEGQQMDMDFENREEVSIEEYEKMISLKTAVLLGTALQMGAYVAAADESSANSLYHFGFHMGMAFQIQDDLLDSFGEKEFGKEIGGDIQNNKKTWLQIKCRSLLRGKEKVEYDDWFRKGKSAEKLEWVLNIFRERGIAELAEEAKGHYQSQALENLDLVNIPENKKMLFKNYAESLFRRSL